LRIRSAFLQRLRCINHTPRSLSSKKTAASRQRANRRIPPNLEHSWGTHPLDPKAPHQNSYSRHLVHIPHHQYIRYQTVCQENSALGCGLICPEWVLQALVNRAKAGTRYPDSTLAMASEVGSRPPATSERAFRGSNRGPWKAALSPRERADSPTSAAVAGGLANHTRAVATVVTSSPERA
jgi:hypothetical protein